jgi:hypothetical protein
MLSRALAVWFGLLVMAFANGALREVVLAPAIGTAPAHVVSSLLLSAAIVVLAWFTMPWIGPDSIASASTVGGMWLVLTLAFEVLAGRYLFGHPWERIWADYNLLRGRIWILVLITVLLAPMATARAQRLLTRQVSPDASATLTS